MRYIDADKLKKNLTIPSASIIEIGRDVAAQVDDQPTADVVEADKVNKIYEKLADLFDTPCNYSPCDEIMFESERCREDCGNIPDAECWRRYFEVVCYGERAEA